MTLVTVRCILCNMEKTEWTEAQVIQYVRDQGYTDVTERKLKRFRSEGVLSTPRIIHHGFGPGTTSCYPTEVGPRVLAICRLLQQKKDYNAVRVGLWLEGYSIETGLLKESLWHLLPFSSLQAPPTTSARRRAALKLTRRILNEVGKSVRRNFARKVLQQFGDEEDQHTFVSMHTQLLYGVPVDFTRTLLGYHDKDLSGLLEERVDIFSYGLQMQQLHFLPKDLAPDLQRLSVEKVLSLTWQQTVLFSATEEDLELVRSRKEIINELFEALDLMRYLTKIQRLCIPFFRKPRMQALFFVFLLVLEQAGYGQNIEMIQNTLQTNLPLMRRYQRLCQTLQEELPEVAKVLLPLFQFSRQSQKEQDAHIEIVRDVYRQYKAELDAFWRDHPELTDNVQMTQD